MLFRSLRTSFSQASANASGSFFIEFIRLRKDERMEKRKLGKFNFQNIVGYVIIEKMEKEKEKLLVDGQVENHPKQK